MTTADTPAASKDAPTDEAVERAFRKLAQPTLYYDDEIAEAGEVLAAHVATLTAKLEAERAKVAKIADERDSLAGELDEANEKLDFIRDIEVVLKAETARETARADAAVAEAKALREAAKPFGLIQRGFYWPGNCGPDSPEDWPDRFVICVRAYDPKRLAESGDHYPQFPEFQITVGDFRKMNAALTENGQG